jgi:hypothetical protein
MQQPVLPAARTTRGAGCAAPAGPAGFIEPSPKAMTTVSPATSVLRRDARASFPEVRAADGSGIACLLMVM